MHDGMERVCVKGECWEVGIRRIELLESGCVGIKREERYLFVRVHRAGNEPVSIGLYWQYLRKPVRMIDGGKCKHAHRNTAIFLQHDSGYCAL